MHDKETAQAISEITAAFVVSIAVLAKAIAREPGIDGERFIERLRSLYETGGASAESPVVGLVYEQLATALQPRNDAAS